MFSHRSLSLYGGHEDEVHCLTFSRDLEILLTGSVRGCLRLWNTVYECLTLKIHERKGRVRAVAISNDDQYFASAVSDVHLRLYRTRTGSLVHLLAGHAFPSDCLQFAANSQLVASGAWDHRTIVWNVTTGEQVYNFRNHTNAVQSIAFHPERQIMITGSHDHDIFLYDFERQPCPAPLRLEGHHNNVQALAFSSTSFFASAGWDKSIIIWHLETKRMHSRLFGHEGWIQALTFRADESFVLASVDDETVCVWNIVAGVCSHRLKIVSDSSCFVQFLPNDGGLLVGGMIYELALNQRGSMHPRLRPKRVYEPRSNITAPHLKLPPLRLKRRNLK